MCRRAAYIIAAAVAVWAGMALEGCKKAPPPARKPVVEKRKAPPPPGILAFTSGGRIWKIEGSSPALQLIDTTAWFPVLNREGTRVAFWEEHGTRLDLIVANLAGAQMTRLWQWNNPPPQARSLNLRNAPCWAPTGDKLYFADGKQIWQVSLDGSNLQTIYEHELGECYSVTVDAKGTSFAFISIHAGSQNLWKYSALSRQSQPLTAYHSLQGGAGSPSWCQTSDKIAFVLYKSEESNVWVLNTASGHAAALTKSGRANSPFWDVSGAKLAVASAGQDRYRWQINLVNVADGKFLQQLTSMDTGAFSPSISGVW